MVQELSKQLCKSSYKMNLFILPSLAELTHLFLESKIALVTERTI